MPNAAACRQPRSWKRANRCRAPVFALDRWAVLDRFLILGVAGGTYYAKESELRLEHLLNLLALLDADGPEVVRRVVAVSRAGRAPRNAPAVAALALAASVGLKMPGTGWYVSADRTGDTPARAETRRQAVAAIGKVCRVPTDLFDFVRWVKRLRGFGPALSKAVARWYAEAGIERLTLHAVKYQARKGFAHADLLRMSHPRVDPADEARRALVRWMLDGGIAAGLDARERDAAAGLEGNRTPSSALRQLEAAEDLLRIDRLGAERARERSALRRSERGAAEADRALAMAFGCDAAPTAFRDDTRALFGVSSSVLAAASSMLEAANDYLDDGVLVPAPPPRIVDMWRVGWRPRPAQERALPRPPEPSLFEEGEVAAAVDLIERASLPHEAVPSHLKRERAVWDALLVDMPLQATVRNLSVMTRVGLLTPGSDAAAYVCGRLRDPALIAAARIHPLLVLQAAEGYKAGRDREVARSGQRRRARGLSWLPVPEILAALDDAFHLAFRNVEPSNARLMLGVDVSSSMEGAYIGDSWLSARAASAAMCLVTARTEPCWRAVGYTSCWSWDGPSEQQVFPGLTPLPIGPAMSVSEAAERVSRLPMGSTDCALPIRYAEANEIEVDCFVSYTDNEHNSGELTPAQALRRYRAASGIPARLVCVGMTATNYSIADPRDPLCLNVVGFDAAAPRIIADFAAGRL